MQERRKHQKIGGGHRLSGALRILKMAPKTFFPEMLATGGDFPVIPYRNCTFLTKFFKKTWKFPNKKGASEDNLVFAPTLAVPNQIHHKKGHFEKIGVGGGHVPP